LVGILQRGASPSLTQPQPGSDRAHKVISIASVLLGTIASSIAILLIRLLLDRL
jgi:hypothetical protein